MIWRVEAIAHFETSSYPVIMVVKGLWVVHSSLNVHNRLRICNVCKVTAVG